MICTSIKNISFFFNFFILKISGSQTYICHGIAYTSYCTSVSEKNKSLFLSVKIRKNCSANHQTFFLIILIHATLLVMKISFYLRSFEDSEVMYTPSGIASANGRNGRDASKVSCIIEKFL